MDRIIEEPEVVHEHYHENSSSGNNAGLLIGIVLLAIMAFLFIYYGLPAIRSIGSPTVNVPRSIDINVNK